MQHIEWLPDFTGRWPFAGVIIKVAPESIRDPFVNLGWFGRTCACRQPTAEQEQQS